MFLTDFEYQRLLPHREKILRFKETRKYKGDEMILFDQIRRSKGGQPTFFDCDGCKAELLNDVSNIIIEYETRKI